MFYFQHTALISLLPLASFSNSLPSLSLQPRSGADYRRDSDEGGTGSWLPPEEYVESTPGIPSEPGVIPPYQRGAAHLPDLAVWRAVGEVVQLTPSGDR